MNEALECSPNYPHTRSSIVTRSHVRNSDFRLITKEVQASDAGVVVCKESSVDSSVGRRPKKSTAVRRSLHKEVDWLRRDFSFVRQQILSASEESVGVCKPTSSVRPSQRGYRLVAKKRVLWVLRFD